MELALLVFRLVVNALNIDLAGTAWALGALGAGVLGRLAPVLGGHLTAEHAGHRD